MMNREEQRYVRKSEQNIGLTKESREDILIDCYINWLQPKVNSPNFPSLSAEDITKDNARKEWDERLQKIQQEHNIDKDSAIKLLNKNFGERPKNLISQEGWFLISDNKEKDVSNIHYSFGFEDSKYTTFWVEIALNSVASVEQFLSMNEKEISKFFEMCKNKPPRMILELTKKTKTNYASSTSHETIIEKEMCNLSEQDIKMIRVKANEIRNIENPLIQPFIGLCVVRFVNKEELAELFSQMEDIYEYMKSLVPRQQRIKNTLREEKQLENRKEEIIGSLAHRKKMADFMKALGRYEDQEKIEKETIKLEQELESIEQSLSQHQELIIQLKEDMGGKIK